jgi:hypothetical protein
VALAVATIALCGVVPAGSLARGLARSAASAPTALAGDARVLGAFAMSARVTAARNVRGEHVGQLLNRSWTLTPQSCAESVCQTLQLDRERSAGIDETLTLTRTGVGTYTGSSSFYVPLRCRGGVHPHGSRAPYRIALTITATEMVQGIAFARQIAATYVNPRRSDATRCPLGPSHDAATYTGSALAPLPVPPVASFATQVDSTTGSAMFADTSVPGAGGAPIVARQWDFGDPASGAADGSLQAAPSHQFSQPGVYTVTLTVTDTNGLTATSAVQVQG